MITQTVYLMHTFHPLIIHAKATNVITKHEAAGGGGWRCYLCDCSDDAVYCKAYRILCSHVQDMSRLGRVVERCQKEMLECV